MKKVIISFILCFLSLIIFSQNPTHTIKIATFNIQKFGKSKISKTKIVDTLSTIVRMFDVIAIQEISDSKNEVASKFLTKINKNSKYHYKVACSARTGQQPKNKSSQEQYAF